MMDSILAMLPLRGYSPMTDCAGLGRDILVPEPPSLHYMAGYSYFTRSQICARLHSFFTLAMRILCYSYIHFARHSDDACDILYLFLDLNVYTQRATYERI